MELNIISYLREKSFAVQLKKAEKKKAETKDYISKVNQLNKARCITGLSKEEMEVLKKKELKKVENINLLKLVGSTMSWFVIDFLNKLFVVLDHSESKNKEKNKTIDTNNNFVNPTFGLIIMIVFIFLLLSVLT